MADTPLIEWLPTIARLVMRTCFGSDSSMSDIRCSRSHVGRERPADRLEEATVDLVDDLQVPRQHVLQERNRPPLQRLRRERVVGVARASPA